MPDFGAPVLSASAVVAYVAVGAAAILGRSVTEALRQGCFLKPRTFGPITGDIVRYAGASGDFNPIHHDERSATAAGFPTVFSIGMFQAALLATYATDWLGAENVRRFGVRFQEQVWPDDLPCARVAAPIEMRALNRGSAETTRTSWRTLRDPFRLRDC